MKKQVIEHFRKVDTVLYQALGQISPVTASHTHDYFSDLCETIVSQQLSGKAGETIWQRFIALFPDKHVSAETLLSFSDGKIRAIGTSRSKVIYLKNLAVHVRNRSLVLDRLPDMPDREVVDRLTELKGIGPWTAEMFLMFSLGREDVFSFGDLGLRNAIKKLYKFKKEPTRKQMEKLSARWAPYRTWAARILWRSLEL